MTNDNDTIPMDELEPASLRDGEPKDEESHARRNLAQLKQIADEQDEVSESLKQRLAGTDFALDDDDAAEDS